MKLRWTPAAERDLQEIWGWRGRERPEVGDAVLDRIFHACERLTRFPHLGPAMPRIADNARKLTVERCLVLYRIEPDSIVVVRVVDQRVLLDSVRFAD